MPLRTTAAATWLLPWQLRVCSGLATLVASNTALEQRTSTWFPPRLPSARTMLCRPVGGCTSSCSALCRTCLHRRLLIWPPPEVAGDVILSKELQTGPYRRRCKAAQEQTPNLHGKKRQRQLLCSGALPYLVRTLRRRQSQHGAAYHECVLRSWARASSALLLLLFHCFHLGVSSFHHYPAIISASILLESVVHPAVTD